MIQCTRRPRSGADGGGGEWEGAGMSAVDNSCKNWTSTRFPITEVQVAIAAAGPLQRGRHLLTVIAPVNRHGPLPNAAKL